MRELLVFGEEKTFKIKVPDDAKITFGPWSPPRTNSRGFSDSFCPVGTLRIYKGTEKNIIGLFTGVHSFRDVSLEYMEVVATDTEGVLYKTDEGGTIYEDGALALEVDEEEETVEVPLEVRSKGPMELEKGPLWAPPVSHTGLVEIVMPEPTITRS